MLNYTITEIRQKIANAVTAAERADWERELVRATDATRELMDKRLGKVSPDWDKQLATEFRRGAYRNGYGY
jgi:hypothetical protein